MTILNHYGPRSEDAWLASLLLQALKDLLPGMFGAELGFLVSLGRSGGLLSFVQSKSQRRQCVANCPQRLQVKTTDYRFIMLEVV